MITKQDIRSLTHEELADYIAQRKLPKFRVKQLEEWLFLKNAISFEEMTNLPTKMRESLGEEFSILPASIAYKQVSQDGTRKYLFEFSDGTQVESVGIPSTDGTRLTVCFSTQAGCAMKCSFCATGWGGFARNLSISEMYDQVFLVGEDFGKRVTNVVAMGQGEPFANYDDSISALRRMNNKMGLEIGARHITLSTCGIIPGIQRFSQEPEQFTLAVSLHSAIQETRDEIMPGVSAYPLSDLKKALKDYGETTKRRPTLEYALMEGVNDSSDHLEALIAFCRGMLSHVNLIPLNPISIDAGDSFLMTPSNNMKMFSDGLTKAGVENSVRSSRGADIDGACGQLKQRLS